jgi:FdhE protein
MDADIQRYIQAMPRFQEALNFLQSILDFQAALAEKLVLSAAEGIEPALRIEPATVREKWRAGQPLFAGESLSIPPSLFREAMADLRSLLPAGEVTRVALDRLLASSFMTPSNVEALLDDLIVDSEACIQRLADATSTAPDVLAFLLHTVLSPFFEKQAAPYREWLETAAWRRGICPVCGSEPWMARLAHDNGQRILACSLCRTEWAFDRLRCPFCAEGDQPFDTSGRTQPHLRHFTVDDDEAHRVDCCDRCHRYIKTVDERVLGRPANLLVEDTITAHLDVLAREQGYQ